MKNLHPDFQWSRRLVSAGFLTITAVVLLSLWAPTVRAGEPMSLPTWYPSEINAINLYQNGISQESSDPQAALKTLLQAQADSHKAIVAGGGVNSIVLHNDALIGRAVATAQMDASKPSDTKVATEKPKNSGSKPSKPAYHVQTMGFHAATPPLARGGMN